jgi:hypothetical protein
VFLFLILAWGCNQNTRVQYKDETGHQVDEERYRNGQLKSKTYQLNEEGTDYIYTRYYEDGTTMDSMVYRNSKLEGTRIYYDQSVGLKHIENYSAGVMEGENKAIYNNGEISYSGYRRHGQKAGAWTFHYPDGRPITYEFYDSAGHLQYFRKYNENGSYQNSNGEVLIAAFLKPEIITLQDTAILTVVTATPPACVTNIEVNVLQEDQSPINLKQRVIENARSTIPLVFQQTGALDLQIEVVVRDLKKEKTESSEKIIPIDILK